jgi:hypothetical protein
MARGELRHRREVSHDLMATRAAPRRAGSE